MQITRQRKVDDHIIPKSGREIEDAAIQHRNEVIDLPHTLWRGFDASLKKLSDYPEGEKN